MKCMPVANQSIMAFDLPGDSLDYHLLTKGVELSAGAPGLTCEIGLRRGGGTKHIIDALQKYCPHKVHIAIDPYGSILYADKDNQKIRLDYTNEMAGEALPQIYGYAHLSKIRFLYFQLEDIEFFERFGNGVPLYELEKTIENRYSFVHFDGPHDVPSITTEIGFFSSRLSPGGCFCFDDIGHYDHAQIEKMLFSIGMVTIHKTGRKALYQYAN